MFDQSILIIYASTSGNVESVCFAVSDKLTNMSVENSLYRAEKVDPTIVNENEFFIFAVSTWEHGVLNPFFEPILKQILQSDMTGKKACFIGLGDMRYEKVLFNKAIEQVRQAFLDKGGEQFGLTLKINGEPYHQIDTIIHNWVTKTFDQETT